MKIHKFHLKLLDPMFYSREGLAGAFTPSYLHATAINHAVAFSLNIDPGNQPYIITDSNDGRDIPRYENSKATDSFYFTPARLIGNLNYFGEIVKGDGDKYIQLGYGAIKLNGVPISRKEALKASKIFSIPPESVFEGYVLIFKEEILMPQLIRLGSFRGKAELTLSNELKLSDKKIAGYVDHPVDPLITSPRKGRFVNMLPYPIVDNAFCDNCLEVYDHGKKIYIALPENYDIPTLEKISASKGMVIF
ncbi:MAG: type I-D CRISPR-associated protein Cas5/Csc1 [Candidatus Methanoperedens sp.]|nr:type I-D CRISPR-associated protein Cas5/Csc1 [Candidatus Methanoperedens sp.]